MEDTLISPNGDILSMWDIVTPQVVIKAQEVEKSSHVQAVAEQKRQIDENPELEIMTRTKVAKILFIPDITEVLMFFVSAFFVMFFLSPILQFDMTSIISSTFLVFWGLVFFSLNAYRWGWADVFHMMTSHAKVLERLSLGEKNVVTFKLSGFLSSLILIGLGFQESINVI